MLKRKYPTGRNIEAHIEYCQNQLRKAKARESIMRFAQFLLTVLWVLFCTLGIFGALQFTFHWALIPLCAGIVLITDLLRVTSNRDVRQLQNNLYALAVKRDELRSKALLR